MKLLKKILIAVVILLALFFGIKKYTPSLNAVYPQQCIFLIDEQFSSQFQKTLKTFVNQKYESCKDLKQILEDVSLKFYEIEAMDAYLCKTDHLCFTFNSSKPLFMLNESVVCNNLRLIQKENFNPNIIKNLHNIESSCLSDISTIVDFIANIPDSIFQEFNIDWKSKEEIILSQKNKKSDLLLFCATSLPTLNNVSLFKQIKMAQKNNSKQIYDFRFSNQIIIKKGG